jgi:hypothetical protein
MDIYLYISLTLDGKGAVVRTEDVKHGYEHVRILMEVEGIIREKRAIQTKTIHI